MSSISVIIPCYNYARYLRGCVASVLDQPGIDVRVLIIDDCSKDDTPDVGNALAREDSRITFRRHQTNSGHIATYNEGIAWADGDYFLLLSADDLATPGALTRAAKVMDEHPNVVMTYGKFFRLKNDDDPQPYASDTPHTTTITRGEDFFESVCRAGENSVSAPTVIVRTSAQKQAGGYNPALPHAGDLEMWLRLAALGDVALIDAMQAHYRFHSSNMHLPFFHRPVEDMQQRLDAYVTGCEAARTLLLSPQGRDEVRGETLLNKLPSLSELAARGVAHHAFWFAFNAFDAGHSRACRDLLDFALTLNPDLATTRDFKRLALKRRLGTRTWKIVMPLLRRLRRSSAEPAPAL